MQNHCPTNAFTDKRLNVPLLDRKSDLVISKNTHFKH